MELNFIKEPLLMAGNVSGLCIYPALRHNESDDSDMRGFYEIWAAIPRQTHSCNVAIAGRYDRWFEDTDALVTFEQDVPIGVLTADCVPILLYAPDRGGVGAVHAGWKGSLGGIVDKTLDLLEENGADLSLLQVAFGPSISKDVYEVDYELGKRFIEAGFGDYVHSTDEQSGKLHIDLQGVNFERLLRRGVRRENIRLHEGCTFGHKDKEGCPLYPSHRRSGGAPARMLSCIMLLSESEMDRYRRMFKGAEK